MLRWTTTPAIPAKPSPYSARHAHSRPNQPIALPDIRRVDLSTPLDDAENVVDVGTWSMGGQDITLNLDGDTSNIVVSADGNILMMGGGALDDLNGIPMLLSSMAMAVRANPPNIAVETVDGTPIDHDGAPLQFVGPTNQLVTKAIRIVNLGDADLTNMSLSIGGATGATFTIEEGLDNSSLAPGAQDLVTIGFVDHPAAGGSSAALFIDSNDADTPSFRVNLSGSGQ